MSYIKTKMTHFWQWYVASDGELQIILVSEWFDKSVCSVYSWLYEWLA